MMTMMTMTTTKAASAAVAFKAASGFGTHIQLTTASRRCMLTSGTWVEIARLPRRPVGTQPAAPTRGIVRGDPAAREWLRPTTWGANILYPIPF